MSPQERKSIFQYKRDDLYYKTFGRNVRQFLQDDFIAGTGYKKDLKGTDGSYFYDKLLKYANKMQFHKNKEFGIDRVVCYFGSLINHREYKKACPKELLPLSKEVYNTFNMFTKEKLYTL